MTPQLELDLDGSRTARGRARAFAGALRVFLAGSAHWAPVWAPLVLGAQILFLGLLPARAESRRLRAAEQSVHARVEALEAEERELVLQERMLGDEIYQERVRRSLVDPRAEPLTLARARALLDR